MSAAPLDWYFDFISPFAYLQLPRIRELAQRYPITPRPIVLAAVLRHHGQLGPAEIPGKREFTYRMVQWTAETSGVALRFPPAHPLNPLAALRLATACGSSWDAITAIFRHIWMQAWPPRMPPTWPGSPASWALSTSTARFPRRRQNRSCAPAPRRPSQPGCLAYRPCVSAIAFSGATTPRPCSRRCWLIPIISNAANMRVSRRFLQPSSAHVEHRDRSLKMSAR